MKEGTGNPGTFIQTVTETKGSEQRNNKNLIRSQQEGMKERIATQRQRKIEAQGKNQNEKQDTKKGAEQERKWQICTKKKNSTTKGIPSLFLCK